MLYEKAAGIHTLPTLNIGVTQASLSSLLQYLDIRTNRLNIFSYISTCTLVMGGLRLYIYFDFTLKIDSY